MPNIKFWVVCSAVKLSFASNVLKFSVYANASVFLEKSCKEKFYAYVTVEQRKEPRGWDVSECKSSGKAGSSPELKWSIKKDCLFEKVLQTVKDCEAYAVLTPWFCAYTIWEGVAVPTITRNKVLFTPDWGWQVLRRGQNLPWLSPLSHLVIKVPPAWESDFLSFSLCFPLSPSQPHIFSSFCLIPSVPGFWGADGSEPNVLCIPRNLGA